MKCQEHVTRATPFWHFCKKNAAVCLCPFLVFFLLSDVCRTNNITYIGNLAIQFASTTSVTLLIYLSMFLDLECTLAYPTLLSPYPVSLS